jgi:hypothetical protein
MCSGLLRRLATKPSPAERQGEAAARGQKNFPATPKNFSLPARKTSLRSVKKLLATLVVIKK